MVAPYDVYMRRANADIQEDFYLRRGSFDAEVRHYWVFSRTPTIEDADYQALLGRFAALGYAATRFRKVIQVPEQIGMAGFWSAGIQ